MGCVAEGVFFDLESSSGGDGEWLVQYVGIGFDPSMIEKYFDEGVIDAICPGIDQAFEDLGIDGDEMLAGGNSDSPEKSDEEGRFRITESQTAPKNLGGLLVIESGGETKFDVIPDEVV